MCLILMAWRVHADYPIVMAANRDEFHQRPTAPAQWWADRPQLLAGRDLEARGTWLGMTQSGQIAALTNFRDPRQVKLNAPSRGGLVVRMLESSASITERVARLREVSPQYSGFSLLCTDGRQLGVFESVSAAGRLLEPGIHAKVRGSGGARTFILPTINSIQLARPAHPGHRSAYGDLTRPPGVS